MRNVDFFIDFNSRMKHRDLTEAVLFCKSQILRMALILVALVSCENLFITQLRSDDRNNLKIRSSVIKNEKYD